MTDYNIPPKVKAAMANAESTMAWESVSKYKDAIIGRAPHTIILIGGLDCSVAACRLMRGIYLHHMESFGEAPPMFYETVTSFWDRMMALSAEDKREYTETKRYFEQELLLLVLADFKHIPSSRITDYVVGILNERMDNNLSTILITTHAVDEVKRFLRGLKREGNVVRVFANRGTKNNG